MDPRAAVAERFTRTIVHVPGIFRPWVHDLLHSVVSLSTHPSADGVSSWLTAPLGGFAGACFTVFDKSNLLSIPTRSPFSSSVSVDALLSLA